MPSQKALIEILIGAVVTGLVTAVAHVQYERWIARRDERYSRPQLLVHRIGILSALGAGYGSTLIHHTHRFSAEWFTGVLLFAVNGYLLGILLGFGAWWVTWPIRHRGDY
jgi:H+/Cl- antiporter ClcA